MAESCDHGQPTVDEPQVAKATLVGPPPSNPPPPPSGAGMIHVVDVTKDWASDDDVAHDECGSQDSEDNASDVSEDAISVLAQVAVEEVMDVAVQQVQSSSSNDANQDNVNVNYEISCSEQELASMEANHSPRPLSVLGSPPAGSQSQCHHDDEDSPDSKDSEEDEERWMFGENSPPSLPCHTSRCSPNLARWTQASTHSEDDDDEVVEVT